jgi:gliding motility-associated-like protein
VTHTSGTQNVAGNNVTVTAAGAGAAIYSNWCGAGPYHIGSGVSQGSYTFTFGTTVTGVRFQITATNTSEVLSFYINGVYYPLSNCNLSNFTGTCGSNVMSISNGNLITTTNVGNGANAQIDICGTINSVTIDCSNNTGNGSVVSAFFTTGTCTLSGGTGGSVTAGANTVSCGGTLNLTATTVTGATSYSWTGPGGFTSNQQNPSITNVMSTQSGTYTVTVVTPCGNLTSSVTVSIATPSAPTVTSPVNYCQGQSSSALQATGQNLLWYTTQTGGTGSSIAPIPNTSTPGTFSWWVSQTINGCESQRTQVTVNVIAVPTTPVVGSNSPLCAGQTLNLTSNFYSGGVYSWTGPGFTSSFQNPSIGNAQSNNAGTYTLIVTVGGCASQPASTTVVVNPLPTLTGASAQNPTTCGGTNGQITLSGLAANTSYTISYSLNGSPQTPLTLTSNNLGQIVITGLGAGSYTNITAGVGGCTSNALGPVNLTGPTPPNITVSVVNATNCNNPNGSLTISGLNPGTYTVNYSINGTPQAPQTLTASGGQIVISGLAPGTYSGITVTTSTTNCTSNTAGPINIGGPVPPNISVTQNPTSACGGTNGSIVISGVTTGSSYVITYDKNGVPQTSITQTSVGGTLTISNLSAGTYSNIIVTIQGCISNTAGPISVTDPAAPVVTANSNSPVCSGQMLNLTSTSSVSGSTFAWSGPNGFTSTQQNPSISNVTTAATGTYTVVVSAGTCSSTMTTLVTVNPTPSVQSAGSNSPVCEGNSINLSATTLAMGTLSWDWTGPGAYSSTQQNPTIGSASPGNAGVYNVTVTVDGCASAPYPVNVNVIATPAITATSQNPNACGSSTGSITLSGLVNGSGYVVNYDKNGVPQTSFTQTASGGNVTIGSLSAGTYTNITVSLNGCPSNIVGPITLSDPTQPPTPVLNAGGPYCEGDNVQITVNNITGATWNWSGPGGFSGTTQNANITNIQTTQAGTYTLVATVNGCNSLPANAQIVVNPVPVVPTITTNSPVCQGEILDVNSNTIPGVTSYSWTGPNLFNSLTEDNSINNAQPVMSGVYTLVVSNGNCSSTASTNVIVNPTPGAPVVVSPTELCQFDVVQLTAQGQNLQWYTTQTGGTPQTSVTPPTTSATLMTYWVSQVVNGCEGPRVPMVVVVKPQPAAPTAQTTYTYCQFDPNPAQLTATGQNIQWYDVATGGTPLPGAPTPNTNIAGIFHYYASQTDSGCESNRTDIEITIHPKPDLPIVEQITICQDDPAPAFNVQGQNLLWYTSATGGTGSSTNPAINTADTGITDHYVSQTINGCEGDRSLIRVTVNPKVVASFSVDKDTVCDSYPLTVTFTGTAPSTAVFDWDFEGASDVTGTGAGPYTVIWDGGQGPKTITLNVSNLNCSGTATKTIVVLPTPDPNFNIQADACLDEEVKVQAAWDQMDMPGYTWDFDGATILEGTGAGPYTIKWTTPGQKVISMSLTNIPCPSLPFYDTLNVHHPEAKIASVSNTDICTADSVLFTAKPGLDYNYKWEPAIFFKEAQSTSLSAWGRIRRSGMVWLTVTDRWGCESKDSMGIEAKMCCDVFLPNAFTPNGDGKNDVFRLVTKGHQEIAVFQVMDRWGKRVFETVNENEAWDGTFNGEAQDIGTYKYYLRYRCADSKETIEMKGDVILLR